MMGNNAFESPPYRWLIEALLVLLLIAQAVTWLAPAPLLSPIINHLHIGLGAGGLLVSIVPACIVVFSLVGGVVSEKLGAVRIAIIGAWAMCIGLVLSAYTHSYLMLLLCRVMQGLGYGVLLAPIATLAMGWFQPREWPYVNIANSIAPFAGVTIVFAAMPLVYIAVGRQWTIAMLTPALPLAS